MDQLQYGQYSDVIQNGDISLDCLKRIIKHDASSGWSDTAGGLARSAVLKSCMEGRIKAAKLYDQKGDVYYGVQWPLPLSFTKRYN